MATATTGPEAVYLTTREVLARYRISRVCWWAWRRRGIAPAGTLLAPGVLRFRLADLEHWEATRATSPAKAAR